jgi:hypothetical protein
LRAGPLELEVLRCGSGRPIVLVRGIDPISPKAPFVDVLAEQGEVIAPSMPGFGASRLPDNFEMVYDLVHLWRDVLDALPDRVALIGFSFGGWIAAELGGGWSSEAGAAGAGQSGRRQARRARGARPCSFLQHEPGRAEPARLARSG